MNPSLFGRASVLWLGMISAEIVHGIARRLWLVPVTGEFRASQIGAVIGSLIILLVAWLGARWLNAATKGQQRAVGVLWLILTLAFEFGFGHWVADMPWSRLLADYNLFEGGILSLGMFVLYLAPQWTRRRALQARTASLEAPQTRPLS